MNDAGSKPQREPALNMPGLLAASIVALLAIQAVRGWLSEIGDIDLLVNLAFIPAPWSIALGIAGADDVVRVAGEGAGDPHLAAVRTALARYVSGEVGAYPWTWLTYSLLHGSWLHVGLNSVWLAAFGSPVMRRAGTARTLLLALAASAGGAIAQWIADPTSVQPMIGASAVVSGFMAAAATFIFARPAPLPAWMAGSAPRHRRPDWSYLRNRNALVFLISWFALNLLFGIAAVPLGLSEGGIAWQGHIGGLLVGLVLFPFLDPGPPRTDPGPPREDARLRPFAT